MMADCVVAVPLRNPRTIPYVGSVVGVALTSKPTICTDGDGEVEGELDGEGDGEADGEADGEGEACGDDEGEACGDGDGDGEPQFPYRQLVEPP